MINPGGVFHNAFGTAFRGCNAAVDAALLRGLGGFDESLGPYGHEDSELFARLTEAGHPIRPAVGMLVYFRETQARRTQLAKVWKMANAEYVYWARHPERFEAMLDPALHVSQVIGAIPYYAGLAVRRQPISPAAAGRDIVTRLGRLRAARRWDRAGSPPPPRLIEPVDALPAVTPYA